MARRLYRLPRRTQGFSDFLVVCCFFEEVGQECESFLEELFLIFGGEIYFLAVEGGDERRVGLLLRRLEETG